MEIKIQKILSDYGICSRRAGEELIQQGNVTVNGSIAMIGQRADPEKDIICVDGKTLSSKPEDTYILLNKPKGYVVTLNDEKGRRNVTDLLQELSVRVYPVGRLDINSEGLLILTNDGQFSNMLTHPSKEIEKELTSLLDDAYSQGWSDAKDDSFFFEDCMRDDGNWAED